MTVECRRITLQGHVDGDAFPDTSWWEEARFGIFMHWGPCTLADAEISWGRLGERPGHGTADKGVEPEVYNELYREFNPDQFDARRWAKVVKASGAAYLIFTTKHHDGFCMFDSELTEYDIMSTPFARDICSELAEACHEFGIRVIWYYSQPDWHHPDYLTERHADYIDFLHGQVRELLTKHGNIGGIWFDGLGRSGVDWDAERPEVMIRELQPGIIINSRISSESKGDFDTPEGHVGVFQIDRPWETCVSMHRGWSYHKEPMTKSFAACLHYLVRCAGRGGNLALNIGPRPDGLLDPQMAERLLAIGQWLELNGHSVRGTTGGPWIFPDSSPMAATRSGYNIYLHLLGDAWEPELLLPDIDADIVDAQLLGGGKASCHQDGTKLTLQLKLDGAPDIDTILKLTLDRSSRDVPPISVLDRTAVSTGRSATSSGGIEGHPAEHCLDNDLRTYWKGTWHDPRGDETDGWIEIDLEREYDIDRVVIHGGRGIRSYQLMRKQGDKWIAFHVGETMNDLEIEVESVWTRYVRLQMVYWWKPEIYAFQVFERATEGL